MSAICCGCKGSACSECSGTPDKAIFVSSSGIIPVASGTCYTHSGGSPNTMRVDWTGYQDFSMCIPQDSQAPCNYNIEQRSYSSTRDIFTSEAQVDVSCSGSFLTPFSATCATLTIFAGTYTLYIYQLDPVSQQHQFSQIMFIGTVTPGGTPPCRIGTLTFTNTVVPGIAYPYIASANGAAPAMWAFASGGTATVTFKKSCCP